MVDPVMPKGVQAIASRLAPVTPVTPQTVAQPAVQTAVAQATQPAVQTAAAQSAPSTLAAISRPAAAAPPVDVDRVAKIKKAIADGNFPLVPSTIADRLLALKLEWNPNDPA